MNLLLVLKICVIIVIVFTRALNGITKIIVVCNVLCNEGDANQLSTKGSIDFDGRLSSMTMSKRLPFPRYYRHVSNSHKHHSMFDVKMKMK